MKLFALLRQLFVKQISLRGTRFSPALCFAQYTKILQKKQKCASVLAEQQSPPSSPLSPEQLERIARNKRAALERLASAQTPPGFGESWRKELAAEFGKPYFRQVRRGDFPHTVFTIRCFFKNDFYTFTTADAICF